ncbi:hypothetical protein V496_03496 [Pseudogymnoascus sp. VKM F-4515 (FW-2607)]|nr:hypothetical protein V496_03496 [Pseudogymnoascus sp. VKM F-4515 (FW-2607)]KFY93757.1 hypothetical protein V498_04279 [Pseudogymnoascus sp. VKM F-4517 (FW-2822)]
MTDISKLDGPNYRIWSLLVKRLLQSRGLWDVVEPLPKAPREQAGEQVLAPRDPPTPPAADFEVRDAEASCLIMELCGAVPLGLIVSIECARDQWTRLRKFYGPSFGQYQGLRVEFEEFAAKVAWTPKGWAQIIGELEALQERIGEVPGGVRPGAVEMLGVLNQVAKEAGGEYGKLAGYLRLKGEYTYETMVTSLVSLEWEEAGSKVGGAAGSSGRNWGGIKWGGGRQ